MLRTVRKAAELELGALATKLFSNLSEKVEQVAAEIVKKAEVHLSKHLPKLLAREVERNSQVKTLFSEGRLVPLDELYVQQRIKIGKKSHSEADLVEQIKRRKRILLSGSAGSGKSLLLKRIFLSLANEAGKKYPIFIELRSIRGEKDTLLSVIAAKLSSRTFKFDIEHVRLALDEGLFALVLDGLDEVRFERRHDIIAELEVIATEFPESIIVISSRSDPLARSPWEHFNEGTILPFDLTQVKELIRRSEEEDEVKNGFLAKLDGGLFEKHKEFLANALLATLMLITYKRVADIPSKMHIFYREAFSALYDRHDASKNYTRRKYFPLDPDEFAKVFAAFCMHSYADSRFEFDEKEALGYLREAIQFEGLSGNERDLLLDLVESFCLLIKDGDKIFFMHRSFQEYFCARFLETWRAESLKQALDHIIVRPQDGVVRLLKGMNEEFFEREWVVPTLKEIIAAGSQKEEPVARFITTLYPPVVSLDLGSEKYYQFHFSQSFRLGYSLHLIGDMYVNVRSRFGVHCATRPELTENEVKRWKKGKGGRRLPDNVEFSSSDEPFLEKTNLKEWHQQSVEFAKDLLAMLEKKFERREADLRAMLGSWRRDRQAGARGDSDEGVVIPAPKRVSKRDQT